MSFDTTKYKYESVIGEGYFCIVKKVSRISDGINFAYKELKSKHQNNSDYQYRFAREIKMALELKDCEQTVNVIDYQISEYDNDIWYIMPKADTNLYDYIRMNNARLTQEGRFGIIKQIIYAVSYAHDRSWLHRDISPHNVLVFNESDNAIRIVVSDFGLGKNADSLSHYTLSGERGYGAPLYVSPEQKEDLNKATSKSDIYSLGKLMFFIMTGKDPMDRYDCNISTIILRCIEEEPDKRYSDIHSLNAHFKSIEDILNNKEFPLDTTTINDYLHNVKDFNWDVFHSILTKGLVYSHPFTDYIEPVVEFFNIKPAIISEYCNHVGQDINKFVDKFISILDELDNRTRWPFSFTADIGKFISNLYRLIKDDQIKLACLNRLWLLGFIYDQWSVQDNLLKITSTEIPSDVLPQFIYSIKETPRELDINKIMSSNIKQYPIKQAMIECHEMGKQIKEDIRKKSLEAIDFI